jgi:hypothetical protein
VFGRVTCWSSALLFMPWSLLSKSVRARSPRRCGPHAADFAQCCHLQVARTLPGLLPPEAPRFHLLWKTITSSSIPAEDIRCGTTSENHQATYLCFRCTWPCVDSSWAATQTACYRDAQLSRASCIGSVGAVQRIGREGCNVHLIHAKSNQSP